MGVSRLNDITSQIIRASIAVHRELGPGLLEKAYEVCLAAELNDLGLEVERQVNVPLVYRGRQLDCGFRLDLRVEGEVIVEVKAIESVAPIHAAQMISYLRLMNARVGLLINFHSVLLKDGIRRFANNL